MRHAEFGGAVDGRPLHPSIHPSHSLGNAGRRRQEATKTPVNIYEFDVLRPMTTVPFPFTLSRSGVRVPQRPPSFSWLPEGTLLHHYSNYYFSLTAPRVIPETASSDEAVDGLVGVVLEGRVGQVGEDVRLVH